jgi:heavy metal sensor kinase
MMDWLKSRNVRTRLTLWYLLIFGTVLIIFSIGVLLLLERSLEDGVNDTLTERTEALISIIEVRDGRPFLPDAVVAASVFDEFDTDDDDDDLMTIQDEEPFARTWDTNGEIVSNAGAHPALPRPANMIDDALHGDVSRDVIGRGEDSFLVLVRPVLQGGETIGVVEVGQPREDLVETVNSLIDILLVVVPVTLLATSLGGWFLARRALQPVDHMATVARRISAEDLSQRLDLALPDDEFGRLARTLDEMIDRIDTAFQRQRQFTADASHELRTPLTALKGHIEVTLEHSRTADEYQEALVLINGEMERLIALVQRLLVLARADAGQIPIEREQIALREIVEAAVEQLTSQATTSGVTLKISDGPDMDIWVDHSLFLQLLMNLIGNAIRHTPANGSVTVSWDWNSDGFAIVIQDTGEGIAPEDLPHIFERFYRADRVRGRRGGHTGLGLAISQWIAAAHGGRISAESSPGSGSSFTVSLPSRTLSD